MIPFCIHFFPIIVRGGLLFTYFIWISWNQIKCNKYTLNCVSWNCLKEIFHSVSSPSRRAYTMQFFFHRWLNFSFDSFLPTFNTCIQLRNVNEIFQSSIMKGHTEKMRPRTLTGPRTQDPTRTQEPMRIQDPMRTQDPRRTQNFRKMHQTLAT